MSAPEMHFGDWTLDELKAAHRTLQNADDLEPQMLEFRDALGQWLMFHKLRQIAEANTPEWQALVRSMADQVYAEIHAGHGADCVCEGAYANASTP